MAGNANFESNTVSPENSGFSGNYSNRQWSNYTGPSLDRSGSVRERSDGRSFSSGPITSKIGTSTMADLLQLEPIAMGNLKKIRPGELRRALGFSFVNNTFGAARSKPPPSLATQEIKRFRTGVHEGMLKARKRMKRFDESLNKLNKYIEVLNSKKQLPNGRSVSSNLLKMGNQSHRNSPDIVSKKLEDKNKRPVLNKRARTPLGDMREEGQSNGVPRQHLMLGKDKGAKESSSDIGDERTRRLPGGGEGWDKKMKRKRSVCSVFPRPADGDEELKRIMHGRLGNDSDGFRLGSINGATISNKIEGAPSPAGARVMPKNEPDKPSLSREFTGMNKERSFQKGTSKLSNREDSNGCNPGSVMKGKASRAHRTGPTSSLNSPQTSSQMSEDWEQPLTTNKVHSLTGVNRKRPLPTNSSSPPMAQWVGQRPQKISRNRRTNIISPTSTHNEVQLSSQGCSPDISARNLSGALNGSFPVRNIMSSSQQLKAKLDNAPSPARLSESEENSGVDNRVQDKELCSPELEGKSFPFTKKGKFLGKDEIGDGARRQGRSGRGTSFPKSSGSLSREKLEIPLMVKPVRMAHAGPEKNGSKLGRPPLKRHSDRKGFTRLGTGANSSSPDINGESDDDHEELLLAAQFACNASYNGCCSSFWKRMESIFYIKPVDKSFLEEELKAIEDLSIQSEMQTVGDNILDHVSQSEHLRTQDFASQEGIIDNGLTYPSRTGTLSNCFQGNDSSYGSLTPLYQRVLSALLLEYEFEEFEESGFIRNAAFVSNRGDLCTFDRISCNGNGSHSRFSNFHLPMQEEIEERNHQNDTNGSLTGPTNSICKFECEYDQMCMDDKLLVELQSIGLHPETMPDLVEGDDELIDQDIIQLKKQLYQQAGKKKAHLDKIRIAIEGKKDGEERDLEQLALNKLIELAYRKLLATRGSIAARIGIPKVSRQVALAFIKRTLARCHKFEVARKSCFSEPALRDVLLSVPCDNIGAVSGPQSEHNFRLDSRTSGSYITDSEPNNLPNDSYETLSYQSDHAFVKNGPILNRGKKKEVLDDVSNASVRPASSLTNGAKGKRTERDPSAKVGRPSISDMRGERKAKTTPKQKASQLSTHPVQPFLKREGLISPKNVLDSSKECNNVMDLSSLPLSELDSIGDLSVGNEFEGNQDLSSWLNLDEVDGLQDHDSMGLEIPMDDLSELNMLI